MADNEGKHKTAIVMAEVAQTELENDEISFDKTDVPGRDRAEIQTRDPERTRAKILSAARDEFSENGFNGARVNEIADRANVNKRLLYHYFGNKEALYSAVLVDVYHEIRKGEHELHLERLDPVEAVDRIVRYTFRHFLENPWFIRLMAVENLQNARFVKKMKDVSSLNSPLVAELEEVLDRGVKLGLFRTGVDPLQLYISITALGYFYVSNMKTMSVVFGRDLSRLPMIQEREAHAVQMVIDHLRAGRS